MKLLNKAFWKEDWRKAKERFKEGFWNSKKEKRILSIVWLVMAVSFAYYFYTGEKRREEARRESEERARASEERREKQEAERKRRKKDSGLIVPEHFPEPSSKAATAIAESAATEPAENAVAEAMAAAASASPVDVTAWREQIYNTVLSQTTETERAAWRDMEAEAAAYRESLDEEGLTALEGFEEELTQHFLAAAMQGKSEEEQEAIQRAWEGESVVNAVWKHFLEVQAASQMRGYNEAMSNKAQAEAKIQAIQAQLEAMEQERRDEADLEALLGEAFAE
ncbi:MAG: hypothetical protein M2R45_04427 [Verrucomicrobia subdivision 3 bacterium]|nr:hypothetical protein [Limisphaerales bacterium]MCS1413515.1 hypothetical protein [Limisphaerales bacterium]